MEKSEKDAVRIAAQLLLNGYMRSLDTKEYETSIMLALYELKALISENEFEDMLKIASFRGGPLDNSNDLNGHSLVNSAAIKGGENCQK